MKTTSKTRRCVTDEPPQHVLFYRYVPAESIQYVLFKSYVPKLCTQKEKTDKTA